MYPHRIRLRGPWECEPLTRTVLHPPFDFRGVVSVEGPVPSPCRVTMPCRWGKALGDFAGRVRFRRFFNYPGRIDPHERVWLTFAGSDYFTTARLNGQVIATNLGPFTPFEAEITSLLRPRNELVVEVDCPAPPGDHPEWTLPRGPVAIGNGGLWREVALEVRCPAHLEHVRMWATFSPAIKLHIAGKVSGVGKELELYVLGDGKTVAYLPHLDASAQGTPFEQAIDMPADIERWWPRTHGMPSLHRVQVDLVQGGSLWYRLERDFGFREIEDRGDVVVVNGREIALTAENYAGVHSPTGPDIHAECDAKGILIRQALPVAPAMPDQTLEQIEAIVRRLEHHACIAGWVHNAPPDLAEKIKRGR
jgi:hypothetical protein